MPTADTPPNGPPDHASPGATVPQSGTDTPETSGSALQTHVFSQITTTVPMLASQDSLAATVERLQLRMRQQEYDDYLLEKRRQLRTSVTLFLLTFASTFLIGSGYFPL
ncbi:MAG: hypothetical protein RLZZ232_3474 [Planctomycetota bacterium]